MSQRTSPAPNPAELLSDEDVYEAMKKIPGYLDISAGDFKELYLLAYEHAETRLYNSLRIAEIMTRQVITVLPTTPLAEAAARMAKHHITGLPVVQEDGTVVGILSERDFFRNMGDGSQTSCMALIADSLASGGCPALCIRGTTAGEIMTTPVVTVLETALLHEAGTLMREKGINRIPVTNTKNRLLGILTRSDLMHAFPDKGIL
ncbi:MAG: CBS domain-containing protein [Deltaproteobacteria bacterium HGW-Deltaproteobacteria-16]|nr:MAG: CBS domain-containing protein [Deltaproteobacteria bacterium HGW-Deltaproteobacteria-16]